MGYKKDLRGYVRIDGSGRIVPGSLVLRRSVPKVGRWIEIPTYECCDPLISTTTTSTTTSAPTTTTTTLTPTTTTTTTSVPLTIRITFDDIQNADLTVGDSSNVDDWNTFFGLPTNGNPFTSVEVVGNEVRLIGGSNITLKNSLFGSLERAFSLLEFNDEGSIVTGEDDVFGAEINGCPNLTYVNLPQLTTAGYAFFFSCFNLVTINVPSLITAGNSCFTFCSLLTTINAPLLTTAGFQCFTGCTSLTTIDLPSLTAAGDVCFAFCTSLTTLNLPLCTALGSGTFVGLSSAADNGVFGDIVGNTITATFNSALATNNGGLPDGDIQYLQSNNTVTITYV